ncbi:hypothetical protein DLAC_08063 [Tieghemostelium lacteum]|uniref:CHCH domain-containing protein n=1 Tax=Tieghemostelium lacteum TaxID=361077 RepID=A0A151ZB27_TIELA|nr:hypothetical protein DLAC_08063 [Tieghemostelium lacteum]|eukprot:KYQ91150.1 hypothetical protein DLAC_08063 [Tieghemostelium lacteum]
MAGRRGASSSRLSKPTTTTASKPAPTKTSTSTPTKTQPQQQQTQTPVVVQGPGMLATLASSMAGSAAGHVIGHALVGGAGMFGGGNKDEVQQVDQQQNYQQPQQMQTQSDIQCNPLYKSFMTCLEKNQNDVSVCQWAYDSFLDCKKGGLSPNYY